MATKLKIDLSQGVLEVEGSETFVKAIYADFKEHFIGLETTETDKKPKRTTRRKTTKAKSTTASKSTTKSTATTSKATPAKPTPAKPTPDPNGASTPEPTKTPTKAPARRRTESEIYSIVEDLELGATEKHPSVVEFMDQKFPITNEERNIVFLYFLEHTLEMKNINLNHIYSCYRAVNIRAPLDIETSLRNTAKTEGWLTWENDKLTLTEAGKKYVEDKLPKRVKS